MTAEKAEMNSVRRTSIGLLLQEYIKSWQCDNSLPNYMVLNVSKLKRFADIHINAALYEIFFSTGDKYSPAARYRDSSFKT